MIVLSLFLSLIVNIDIIKANDCQYSTPDGILDLRTFGFENRPKFTNIPDTNPLTTLIYSFNGCFSYSTTDKCQNAAACSTDATQSTRLIARQAGRAFTYNKGLSTIMYSDGAGTTLRVLITCTTSESMEATKITDQSFLYNIESACGCPGKCNNKLPPSGLTGGGIFLIVLVCIIVVYLLTGVLFLRFVRHERGANMIPHRIFWLAVGQNSLGGVRYLRSRVTKSNNYEAT